MNLPVVRGHVATENFEKLSFFNDISCIFEWVFMHGVSDK